MNVIVEVGNLTRDPELRYSENGTAVCTFTIAVDRAGVDESGEVAAGFFPVVCFEKRAELAATHLSRGRLVAVHGRLRQRRYTKDGQQHTIHEIVANEVKFLDYRKEAAD